MTDSLNAPHEGGSEAELDADSLAAIRSILTEDTTPEPQAAEVAGEAPMAEEAPQLMAAAAISRRRKSDAFPALEDPVNDPAAKASGKKGIFPKKKAAKPAKRRFSLGRKPAAPKAAVTPREPSEGGVLGKIKGYRPKPLHIGLAVLGLVVLMRPWLFVGLGVIFLIIMVGVYLMVGYDGFWKGAMRISRWYADRQPARAAKLHARLDTFAMRWDAILDKFPEGSVDALYLPDFGDLATADKRHDSAMERRLAGLQESGS
ncbi:MAG: hypothetical protein ABJJ03_10140 [Sulfitobacter sp.]|uniref:hypothetical protein n=1 Tax=Ascidiaceihabitans sp. TaxID=1872644 RepID=UPI003296D1AE